MAKINILVSIVNWNSGGSLRTCVESFFAFLINSDLNFLIKVYDNNSTDDSYLLNMYDEKYVTLTRGKKNEGLRSHGYNIKDEDFDFLIVSNSDILYKSGNFDDLIKFMQREKDASMLGFQIFKNSNEKLTRMCHTKGFPSAFEMIINRSLFASLFRRFNFVSISWLPERIRSALHLLDIDSYQLPIKVDRVSGCVFIIKKHAVEQTGLFDPMFFMYVETIDLLRRLKNKNLGIYYYPKFEFTHFGGISNRLGRG